MEIWFTTGRNIAIYFKQNWDHIRWATNLCQILNSSTIAVAKIISKLRKQKIAYQSFRSFNVDYIPKGALYHLRHLLNIMCLNLS